VAFAFSALTLLVGWQEGHPASKKYWGWWRWALVRPDGVAPSRMGSVSASVNLPLHHKVQNFSSGTGSLRWSRKKGHRPLQPWTQHRTLTSLWTIISRCRCMSAPCVAQHFVSCASDVRSCDRCRLMRPRQVLQPVFYMAFPTSCSGAYRPYRMLQHAWSLAPEGVTTSPRSCSNYTGYQYDSEWNLSSLSCAQQPGATTSVR